MDIMLILPIVLLILGIILLIIEVLIPGFGVSGISGIICLILGIVLTAKTYEQAIIIFVIILVILIVIVTILVRLVTAKKLKSPIILYESLKKTEDEYNDIQYFLGKKGIAVTTLRPSGNVDFDGVKLDVMANGTYVEKGKEVEVIKVQGNKIIVEEISND